MERGALFFCGIIVVAVATFIPMAFVSGRTRNYNNYKAVSKASCDTFKTPWAPVGQYDCKWIFRDKTWTCVLQCPAGMLKEPRKEITFSYFCKKGQWSSNPRDDRSRCIARHTVDMVQQQLADPKLINDLLNNYLNNSYNYLALAYFCDRADVQLPGFHKFFLTLWHTSTSMARDVMAYINRRGGWIEMQELPKPAMRELMHQSMATGRVGLVAMETALTMERESQDVVSDIISKVDNKKTNDPHLVHVLEDNHLSYKVKVVKEIAEYITRLRSFQTTGEEYSLGQYEVDNNLQ